MDRHPKGVSKSLREKNNVSSLRPALMTISVDRGMLWEVLKRLRTLGLECVS